MRPRLLVIAVVLAALPLAAAAEPYVVLLDWQQGHTLVGTTRLLASPLAPTFAVPVDQCHRQLLVDLLYSPAESGVDQDGVGEVFVQHDWIVQLARGGEVVAQSRISRSGYGHFLALADEGGDHDVRLSLANGANVSWELRVRGREVVGELACEPRVVVTEVEADPPGPDANGEWIEILNAGDEGEDLSMWKVRTTHGVPRELELPANTWLDPGERLVVAFPDGVFLDNEGEAVELVDPFFGVRDATPALDDVADDARTWQRVGDGASWSFADGTPGAPAPP